MFIIFAAVVIVATGVFIVLNRPDGSERAVDDGRAGARDGLATGGPSSSATGRNKEKRKAGDDATALPGGLLGGFPGLGVQPGMGGDSSITSLPKHTLTIRLSSPRPLGLVAYVIPTSTNDSQGSLVENGNTWTLTTTVYGNPDYAVVYLQAGPEGKAETCEITVDGKVTERRSTEGPYSTMWCQG